MNTQPGTNRRLPGRWLRRAACLGEQLYWGARKMKAAVAAASASDWAEEQVKAEVSRIFTHAEPELLLLFVRP